MRAIYTITYFGFQSLDKQRVNERVGLCTQWKLCCLETLMQLDATINDVTTTTNQIYTYKASSCFRLAGRSRHVPRAIIIIKKSEKKVP